MMTTLDVQAGATPPAQRAGATRLRKRILRLGRWDSTPTPTGKLSRPLMIHRNGGSAIERHAVTVALQELLDGFGDAYQTVPVVLSNVPGQDHAASAASYVGTVDALDLEQDGGQVFLTATLTIPDHGIRSRVLSGVLPDVSAGLAFGVVARSGRRLGAALEHLSLTARPFIDGLGAFSVAASQAERGPMVCFAMPTDAVHGEDPQERLKAAQEARRARGGRPLRPVYHAPLSDRVAQMKAALGKGEDLDLQRRADDMREALGRPRRGTG